MAYSLNLKKNRVNLCFWAGAVNLDGWFLVVLCGSPESNQR